MYSTEIGKLIRNYIHHLTKPDFFLAFYDVFYATSHYDENMPEGFVEAGFAPFNLEKVIC